MNQPRTAQVEKHIQVSDQCRAVAHLATIIAQIYSDKAALMAANAMPSIVDFVGNSTARLMEALGDIINGMDAAEDGDEWLEPIFKEAQRLWPQEASQ